MKLLLITGGKHPYEETTPVLTKFLQDAGHDVTVSASASELAGSLNGFDAIVLNTLRQPATENDLSGDQRNGLKGYVNNGGGLVSVHISAASCPDWADMKKLTGGGWVLGKSWHPPFGW
ncbi:MAG: ThuA domain-containing protein, partial [Chloroflexi bacterium]|nr:ThuA domain-containing protein [Chloroflexota bacterium]